MKPNLKSVIFTSLYLLVLMAAPVLGADAVYTLDNVRMAGNGNLMTGTFVWTYDEGDFENGTGQFTDLDIPYTAHDQTDLVITIEVDGSIEFTLDGNFHDDGVDIMLRFEGELTPTTGVPVDLEQSSYDIGGNGFHSGGFMSGSIQPATTSSVGESATPSTISALAAFPNPFNPQTTIAFDLPVQTAVSLRVYDIGGRLIDVLMNNQMANQGRNEATWRGRDMNGREAPAGIYFYRLEAGGYSETKRMALIK